MVHRLYTPTSDLDGILDHTGQTMDKLTQAHIAFVNTSTATQSNIELRVSLRANRAEVAIISRPSSGAKTEVQYERISIVTENEVMNSEWGAHVTQVLVWLARPS